MAGTGPGSSGVPGLGNCADCSGGCSTKFEWIILIRIPPSVIDWINSTNAEVDAGAHCADLPPMPEPTDADWDACLADINTVLPGLDFDSPPIAFPSNQNCDDLGCHCPSYLAITNWPAIVSGSVGYEWCTFGSALPDGCNSSFMDFFFIPNPLVGGPALLAGPQGGITINMNQGTGPIGFGIASCAPSVPFMAASRLRLTGYPSVCQSLRNYENEFDSLTVDDCGSVAAVGGHILLPYDADFPLTRPSVPHATPLDLLKVRARGAWIFQPCGDCACP